MSGLAFQDKELVEAQDKFVSSAVPVSAVRAKPLPHHASFLCSPRVQNIQYQLEGEIGSRNVRLRGQYTCDLGSLTPPLTLLCPGHPQTELDVMANELEALKDRNAELERELADKEAERSELDGRLRDETTYLVRTLGAHLPGL